MLALPTTWGEGREEKEIEETDRDEEREWETK
jgi:hypothetical protein